MRAARRDAGWALVVAACLLGACGVQAVDLMSATSQPRPPCVSIPQSGGPLYIYCGDNYSQQEACLKCGATPSYASCTVCFWSDAVDGGVCQECVDPTGKVSFVDCNELRTDLTPPAS